MKAIIFNSGLGSRMKGLTENNPKCMVKLYNGETIFERQLRILRDCGIKEIIVTTGPFQEQLYEVANRFSDLCFEFVSNEDYENTNYIVSMHLANRYLDDDMLLLHGDLVFNPSLVLELLNHKSESVCLYHETKALPKKDFKGRFHDKRLLEVSVNIFEEDCYAFQPFYKLSKNDLQKWKDKVGEFVQKGEVKVYAENALNEILSHIKIQGMSYKDHYIDEIDDEEDYYRVLKEIQWFDAKEEPCKELKGKIDFAEKQQYDKASEEMIALDADEQKMITVEDGYEALKELVQEEDKIFFVCSKRNHFKVQKEFSKYPHTIFSTFTSNPKYEEIMKGVELFRKDSYSVIVSIGGGSAIDVAKCIKLFATVENEKDVLKKQYGESNVKHIAMPTTAGSGSESTQFAVMYYHGVKHSVDHESILPEYVILVPTVLETLPDIQKKSTLLDALCQAIESFWAKGATKKSREYAKKSIGLILSHYKDYLNGKVESYEPILKASNYSGRAIHITRTTAAHAMSYKLTTDYQINHGHAVALCIVPVWKSLFEKSRDNANLRTVLEELSKLFGTTDIETSIEIVAEIIEGMKLPQMKVKEEEIEELVKAVDVSRLSNHPVELKSDEIYALYGELLFMGQE